MDAASLAEAARAGMAEASRRAGTRQLDGTLAGRGIRISCAGDHFAAELSRALAFIGPATEPIALTVHAWDGASTGVRLAWHGWQDAQVGPAGIVGDIDPRYHVSFDVYGALMSLIDFERREAFHYLPDPTALPYWERTHPARLLWSAWARAQGLLVCHAAAVAEGGRGILLCGSGGAGKSTSALACLADGMASAGDDYVLIDPAARPSVHALYTSTLLEADHAARHGTLMPTVDRRELDEAKDRRKVVMYATGEQRPRMASGFPLVALAALRVEPGAAPRYQLAGAGAVLRALAPSSLAQLGMVDGPSLARLAGMTRSMPCYELVLGRDPQRIPDLVREMIAAVQPEAAS